MASLVPPSNEEFAKISSVQQEREAEIKEIARRGKRQSVQEAGQQQERQGQGQGQAGDRRPASEHRRQRSIDAFRFRRAAKVIQRTYRDYRSNRETKAVGLDASTRWVTAIQDAQFRDATKPRSRAHLAGAEQHGEASGNASSRKEGDEDDTGASYGHHRSSVARENWKRAAIIARKAGHDDADSDSPPVSGFPSDESFNSPEQQAELRRKKEEAAAKRKESSMMMGLQYFLEMVDVKHRYGSNLRVYHEEWKKQETNENFFYWLDYGEGRNVDMAGCPRDRLERERVRYLSREERQYYLVNVDDEGRLCWAKDGARIDTTVAYKDSIRGIVPAADPTPAWSQDQDGHGDGDGNDGADTDNDDNDSRSASSIESALEADRAAKYATPDFDNAKGPKKVTHVSASTIFNKLLRKSVRKNTWIFVADTNFRLYVGIKSSGAFQHSSFLQGSRISAAGLIKVRDGRLASLSPLSGHYRPPASNFRAFVRSLRDAGVDMSRVSISKSYAVLVGLETYGKARRKGQHALEKMTAKKEKIVAPEEVARKEEEERDKTESAEKERRVLEAERRKEEGEREENKAAAKVMRRLGVVPTETKCQNGEDGEEKGGTTEAGIVSGTETRRSGPEPGTAPDELEEEDLKGQKAERVDHTTPDKLADTNTTTTDTADGTRT